MWKLVIEDDEGKRTVVPLTREHYSIGRKEGNTIRLTERNVSRDHAKLRKKNGVGLPSFVLEDCTSYNGVYVNGLRVATAHELAHGDLIQIGDYRIVLQDDAVTEHATGPSQFVEDMKATIPTGGLGGARASLMMERPNRLVMLAGPTPGTEYPLDRERLSVGRAEDAVISVNHNSVSRMHCEIHSLGEGRFEIIDKHSSNGVRVNGSDLRRGIVEAGDVIELGDVKFKFVGAGQIFLPGVNDNQQLEAIQNRAPSPRADARWPYVVIGMIVCFGVAVGLYVRRQKALAQPPAVVAAPTPEEIERGVLLDAKRLCDNGNCELAHEKVTAAIPQGSPLRESDDFRIIEVTWADSMLDRAEKEESPAKRRQILHVVEQTETVDATRRRLANERLQAMDTVTPPGLMPAPAPTTSVHADAGRAPSAAHAVPTDAAGTHPAPKPSAAAATSPFDQAREKMLKGDLDGAKNLLMPRVAANKAGKEEITFLLAICKGLKDDVCASVCKQKLGSGG